MSPKGAFPELTSGRRPVGVVSFAQYDNVRREDDRNEVEMLLPVVGEVFGNIGITKDDVGFICSGSTDYLIGGPFSFVAALDAVGVWPPRAESHVEMDGAWALYEAWVLLQEGEIDAALVYAFGRSSMGDLSEVMAVQLDPYYLAPLWPDPTSLAALQAQAMIDGKLATEADFAAVASRSRRSALGNPKAQVAYDRSAEELLREDYEVAPLRRHALPPLSDGCAAIVLAAGDKAYEWCERPAFITGIDHRIETHSVGARDLTASPSTRVAGEKAGVTKGKVDVAELHAPFAHQEIILRSELGLGRWGLGQPLGWRAGGQPDDVGRPDPHRRGGATDLVGRGRPGGGPRHLRACACSRTSWPCWRVCDGGACRSHRSGPDGVQVQARGRVDRRARARGRRDGAGGRGADLRRHRRGRRRQGARHVRGRHDARAVSGAGARRGGQADVPRAHGGVGGRVDVDRGGAPRGVGDPRARA